MLCALDIHRTTPVFFTGAFVREITVLAFTGCTCTGGYGTRFYKEALVREVTEQAFSGDFGPSFYRGVC